MLIWPERCGLFDGANISIALLNLAIAWLIDRHQWRKDTTNQWLVAPLLLVASGLGHLRQVLASKLLGCQYMASATGSQGSLDLLAQRRRWTVLGIVAERFK